MVWRWPNVRCGGPSVDPAFTAPDPAPVDQLALDVALLELAEPIPTADIAPFVVDRPGAGDEVSVISYAAGREDALSWQRVCQARWTRQDGLFAVRLRGDLRVVGAPVLDRSGYRAKIVSIISAGSTNWTATPIAIGMELPARVAALKDRDLRRAVQRSLAVATAGRAGAKPKVRKRITCGRRRIGAMPGAHVRHALRGLKAGNPLPI
jgi:protease YdgD